MWKEEERTCVERGSELTCVERGSEWESVREEGEGTKVDIDVA